MPRTNKHKKRKAKAKAKYDIRGTRAEDAYAIERYMEQAALDAKNQAEERQRNGVTLSPEEAVAEAKRTILGFQELFQQIGLAPTFFESQDSLDAILQLVRKVWSIPRISLLCFSFNLIPTSTS